MRPNGRNKGTTPRKGFSILELLIAIIIIGILAAILIPVISSRTEKARIASAQGDLERIADGLDRVQIDTGYYTRMFMLNDSLGGDTIPFQRNPIDPSDTSDGVRDYGFGAGYFQSIDQLFIDANTGLLVTPSVGAELYNRLSQNETEFNWNGSYVNWQKDLNKYSGDSDPRGEPDGLPDDPWGNNYLLFTSQGIVLEPDGVLQTAGTVALPRFSAASVSVDADQFDRATVVSLGPDGLPGDGGTGKVGTGDDIIRSFGR